MKGWKKMIVCCLSAILAATAFALSLIHIWELSERLRSVKSGKIKETYRKIKELFGGVNMKGYGNYDKYPELNIRCLLYTSSQLSRPFPEERLDFFRLDFGENDGNGYGDCKDENKGL